MNTIYVGCAIIICAILLFLMIDPKFEDGLVGRIAIAILTFGQFFVIYDAVLGISIQVRDTTLFIQVGMALLLLRLLYRFLKRRHLPRVNPDATGFYRAVK